MTNQDIDGKAPPETAAAAPGAPSGAPETLEQQLEKEREQRALMRERLRTTEALAAESHALRARMAQELERVTADRDRLRTEAEAAASAGIPPAAPPVATTRFDGARGFEPPLTSGAAPARAPHAADRPLKPPVRARRKGPWGALAMLGVVAIAVGAVAWYKGSLPDIKDWRNAFAPAATAPAATANAGTAPTTPPAAAAAPASPVMVAKVAPSPGAVALPPVAPAAPEAQLAATPPAAGPAAAPAPATGTSPTEMTGRLRKALDGEGIASPVDVDAATGRVQVTDPQADGALRQRTELVIRAVYAGASLPEPQIEHRWLSPMHGARETTAAADVAPVVATQAQAPAPVPADTRSVTRRAALARTPERRKGMEVSVADAEELTPVLPAGRVTASCMDGLVGRSAARRANMTACMKHSCCSSAANHNSEECRAYERAFPFTCGAG